MTTYEDQSQQLNITPCFKATITLGFCSLVYGVGACTATGSSNQECFNTFATCQDKANFDKTTKDYVFSSVDTPLPLTTARPYIESFKDIATEIKKDITVTRRISLTFRDEPDTDYGIDPYVDNRTSVQGTFWKKLLARNPNYIGATIVVAEGAIIPRQPGVTPTSPIESTDFTNRFEGKIENITIKDDQIVLKAVDYFVDLKDTKIPRALELELVGDITSGSTEITVSSSTDISAPFYFIVDDEIIYAGALNTGTNVLSTLTRGMFNTTAAAHDDGTKIQEAAYYAPGESFAHAESILSTAGIAAGNIDSTAFTFWADFPRTIENFSAIIIKPESAKNLYFELIDLLNSHSWQNEEQKITVRRHLANDPNRSYTVITDEANIVSRSGQVDLNADSRYTRVVIYHDKNPLSDDDKDPKNYNAITIAVDADAESTNLYGEVRELVIFSRWFRKGYLPDATYSSMVANLAARRLQRVRESAEIVTFDLSIKDQALITGGDVRLSTDEILTIDGQALSRRPFFVIKRTRERTKLKYQAMKLPTKKIAFIAPANFNNSDGLATAQTLSGAGNMALVSSPDFGGGIRRVRIQSTKNDSGITFTVTGLDENGDAQVSAAFAGPNGVDLVIAVDGSANELWWTDVTQIAHSGSSIGEVKAGVIHGFSQATEDDKDYGFIGTGNGVKTDLDDGEYYIY